MSNHAAAPWLQAAHAGSDDDGDDGDDDVHLRKAPEAEDQRVPETLHVLDAVREMVQGIDDLMAHVWAAGEQQHWASVIDQGALREVKLS
jgi:hypothetical protein